MVQMVQMVWMGSMVGLVWRGQMVAMVNGAVRCPVWTDTLPEPTAGNKACSREILNKL